MGRGKAPSQKKTRHERGQPAESANDVSSSLSSLSIGSGDKSSFPIPLAMWVYSVELTSNSEGFQSLRSQALQWEETRKGRGHKVPPYRPEISRRNNNVSK
jgi:hypothetical protein